MRNSIRPHGHPLLAEIDEKQADDPQWARFPAVCKPVIHMTPTTISQRGICYIVFSFNLEYNWHYHSNTFCGTLKAPLPCTPGTTNASPSRAYLRGLLDDILVIWGGEFGRTLMVRGDGRDHHPKAFSICMAGGGIKPGITFGDTDDFGFQVGTDRVHVHDLNATILHLLGLDHKRLTYRFQGRDFQLTDVHGQVVKGLLA